MAEVAKEDNQKEFEGALPSTIYQAGFSEVYGQNPSYRPMDSQTI